ncbi:MAG: 4Fe-4S binding protein [Bacteroidetes bacterium]|nr:4Fe-4S binding protein [Bacteroidota bacterium]MBL7105044.1 4Fe-4S binding protein [Bacteroidales bacterium]
MKLKLVDISYKRILYFALLILLTLNVFDSAAQQRFPKPEFETGHTQPPTLTPEPRAELLEIIDVGVLILSLSLITWFILKKRSRKGVFWMSIFSIVYFGFYREGCVCSVGSLQNITLALFLPEYKIPVTVIAFFVIPLIYTLFFGRTFCAGICPLGAIQDIFVIKPYSLKSWANSLLGLFPYIYLGLAVLYAATATDFIVCRYDPFIGIFRFNGTFFMLVIGGIFLLTSIFIARPYCRFFCPYGVLLNIVSRFSGKHMTITPTECIQCKLCENSCPFDAIQKPVLVNVLDNRRTTVKRFIQLSLIIPLLIFLGGWTGSRFHENLASVNPKVRLANVLLEENNEINEDTQVEIDAFKSSGNTEGKLYSEAASIVKDFYTGGWILGGFLGLVFGLTLAGLSRFQYRTDYTPNKGTCLSCARCMDYCPVRPGKETEFTID